MTQQGTHCDTNWQQNEVWYAVFESYGAFVLVWHVFLCGFALYQLFITWRSFSFSFLFSSPNIFFFALFVSFLLPPSVDSKPLT